MFCKNCGIELNEAADFCPECGVKVEDLHISKKIVIPKTKRVFSLIIVVLAIIVTLICVKTTGVNSSPEKVAVATVKSEYEIDIKTMVKCFPEFTLKEIAEGLGLSEDASRSEIIREIEEDYRYETPQDIEIIRTELVSEYDISEYTIFREIYDYMTDKEYDSITKVAKVDVEFTVDGDREEIQLTCIKMKNKWYFLRNS